MKKRMILLKLLRFSGLPFFLKMFNQKNRISVIFYHNIDPVSFEEQVKYANRHYNLISIETLEGYLYNKIDNLPSWPLLITFDDGHAANYKLLKIFKQYNLRPTIFLTANMIGSNRPYWFNLAFKTGKEKEYLKTIPDSERLEYLEKNYAVELNEMVNQSLTWNEVNEMAEYVDFHSHTVDHPCLPNCTSVEMTNEIVLSKDIIEDKVKKECFAIAYPNGDYSDREIEAVKKAKYTLGFTVKPGYVNKTSNPYALNRFSMNDTDDLDDFILRVTGTWFLIRKFVSFLKHPWKT